MPFSQLLNATNPFTLHPLYCYGYQSGYAHLRYSSTFFEKTLFSVIFYPFSTLPVGYCGKIYNFLW